MLDIVVASIFCSLMALAIMRPMVVRWYAGRLARFLNGKLRFESEDRVHWRVTGHYQERSVRVCIGPVGGGAWIYMRTKGRGRIQLYFWLKREQLSRRAHEKRLVQRDEWDRPADGTIQYLTDRIALSGYEGRDRIDASALFEQLPRDLRSRLIAQARRSSWFFAWDKLELGPISGWLWPTAITKKLQLASEFISAIENVAGRMNASKP
ncbi:hypothetical protein ACFL6C_11675 [Myxococcota bacterium]